MSRKALLLTAIAACLGAVFALLASSASCPSPDLHPNAGDPPSRARETLTVRHTRTPSRAAVRRRPPLDELPRALAAAITAEARQEAPWVPTETHLAQFEPVYRDHVATVGAYIHHVFSPRLKECLDDVRPIGRVEITQSFLIDEDGIAWPAPVFDLTDDAITVAAAEMHPDDLELVTSCMRLVASETSFAYAPVNQDAPPTSFVAHQTYGFGRR